MKYYINTCNKFIKHVEAYAYLMNKYWSIPNQEVVILGYDAPKFTLPDNFSFVSIADTDPGVDNWSTPIVDYFKSIDDEYFGWGMDNLWFAGPVNPKITDFTIEEIEAGRIDKIILDLHEVCTNAKFEIYNKDLDIYQFTKGSLYKCCAETQIVKRDFLLKYLKPCQSPWEYEQDGQKKAKDDDSVVLFTSRESSPKLVDVIWKGQIRRRGRLGIQNMLPEDLTYLRTNKLIDF